MQMIQHKSQEQDFSHRWSIMLALLLVSMSLLMGRAVYLQVLDKQFLKHQGDLRHLGIMPVPAHRGRILDRNGEVLAVSMPVKSIWVSPKEFLKADIAPDREAALAEYLGIRLASLKKRIGTDTRRRFAYLRRRMDSDQADRVLQLGIPGIYADREYRRYYPTGEVTSQLLGLTNIDDQGQEGLELAFNETLKGVDGARRAIRDGKRRIIEKTEEIRSPKPGQDLVLGIDERMQYVAYRELREAVNRHRAKSGTATLLDAHSGEVLAMVNYPSFDPNNRSKRLSGASRNRAMTDLFEPGSTMKPFAVACALELGLTRPDKVYDTEGGRMQVGKNLVRDVHAYGRLDVGRILQKSSNVGVTKIALSVPARKFWAFYNNLGFGQPLETGFPGEAHGRLPNYQGWNAFKQATLSFGYALSTSTVQLGRAYLALANDGVVPMVSLVKREGSVDSHRIMSASTAVTVRTMLEKVVGPEGTALKAAVPGYRVAGKTGTSKKAGPRGYLKDAYNALFAGLVPASDPRFVMVVMIDEPSAGTYYGGTVAAPVFSSVMQESLRLMNVPPDDLGTLAVSIKMDDPA